MSAHQFAVAMVRRRGSPTDDLVLRVTAAVALLGIVGLLLSPTVAALTGFTLYTVLTNGPYSAVLPAAYEPVLLLYGGLFPPLLIAALGTIATVFVEWVNYHLYAHVRDTRVVRNLNDKPLAQRVTRMFERRPFLAVALCALGVVPYTMARCLSVLARYPVWRHLAATAVGRYPRLWAIAALGVTLRLPSWVLVAGVLFSLLVAGALWVRRSSLVPQSA